MESDRQWHDFLKTRVPANVTLHSISIASPQDCVRDVSAILAHEEKFDVIIIDALYRAGVLEIAIPLLKENGIIICDNSSIPVIAKVISAQGLQHVEFYGHAPGVIEPGCTSIVFREKAFVFAADIPVPLPPLYGGA